MLVEHLDEDKEMMVVRTRMQTCFLQWEHKSKRLSVINHF